MSRTVTRPPTHSIADLGLQKGVAPSTALSTARGCLLLAYVKDPVKLPHLLLRILEELPLHTLRRLVIGVVFQRLLHNPFQILTLIRIFRLTPAFLSADAPALPEGAQCSRAWVWLSTARVIPLFLWVMRS